MTWYPWKPADGADSTRWSNPWPMYFRVVWHMESVAFFPPRKDVVCRVPTPLNEPVIWVHAFTGSVFGAFAVVMHVLVPQDARSLFTWNSALLVGVFAS